eukprot:6767730-Heterocapsa_arctica.AAC.1
MNINPALRAAVDVRCIEWFYTAHPTDAHLVPDNPFVNEARKGAFIMAKAQFGCSEVPLGGLPGTARGS